MKYIFLLFIFLLIIFRYNQLKPRFLGGQKTRTTKKVLTEAARYVDVQGFKLLGLKIYLPTYPEIYYGDDDALVLWTIPPMTVFGGVAGILRLISFVLANFILFIIYPLSYWFVFIVNYLG